LQKRSAALVRLHASFAQYFSDPGRIHLQLNSIRRTIEGLTL